MFEDWTQDQLLDELGTLDQIARKTEVDMMLYNQIVDELEKRMPVEEWKDIPGYEGLYQVSNVGNVRSLGSGKIMAASSGTSYRAVCLSKAGKQKVFYIHRLVATAFIPNPDNLPQVNHINCDTHDNRVENLEWCTREDNQTKYFESEKFKRICEEQRRMNNG